MQSKWYTSLDQATTGGKDGEPMQVITAQLNLWRSASQSEIRLVFSPEDLFNNHWSSGALFSVLDAARAAKSSYFVFLSNNAQGMVYLANWWQRHNKIKAWPQHMLLMARATTQDEATKAVKALTYTKAPTGLLVQPMQSGIELDPFAGQMLSWVVAGGGWDSFGDGITATATHWLVGLADQCAEMGIPFHFAGYGRYVDIDEAVASGAWAAWENMRERDGLTDPPFHYESGHPVPYVSLPEHIMPTTLRGKALAERPHSWQLPGQ